MTAAPQQFIWDGEAMHPKSARAADEAFVIGEVYTLVEHEERSRASHNFFFVSVSNAFDNLSDEQRLIWPTEDALRKYALCKAGCCDVATHVCPSKAAAASLRDFLHTNGLADLIVHDGPVVTVLTAWSMKFRAMGAAKFRECADKALPILAEIIGVDPDALQNARAA